MQIQINPADVPSSEAIVQRVEQEVRRSLKRFVERVTRVEVHLHDANGRKAGVDKRCTMEARIGGYPPLAVEHQADDLYEAIAAAARKLHRAVAHRLERQAERRH